MLQFRNKYYKLKMKQTKDSFLLKFVEVKPLKYLQVGQKCGPNDFRIIYKVPKQNGRLIRVCQRAFVDVLAVYWSRVCNMVQTLIRKGRFDRLRHSLDTSVFPANGQGGLEPGNISADDVLEEEGENMNINTNGDGEELESFEINPNNHLMIGMDEEENDEYGEEMNGDPQSVVIKFVKSFSEFQVHKCYGKGERHFLPKELNLDRLWTLFTESEIKMRDEIDEGTFKMAISESLNLKFGNSSTDFCQKCKELQFGINSLDAMLSRKSTAELYAHECQVSAFQTLLHDSDPSIRVISIKHSNKISLPKFSTHPNFQNSSVDCFYVTIVEGSDAGVKENVSTYLWTEVEAQNGINELVSVIYYKLLMLNHEHVKTIRIVNAGCSSVLYKRVLMTMCVKFLEEDPNHSLKALELIDPVPGHFTLPPDQICDCIRYVTNQRNHILNPDAITEILRQFGSVHQFQEDVPLLDFKGLCDEIVKPDNAWHFALAKCKRIVISRALKSRSLVRGEQFYNHSFGYFESILKEPIYGKILVKLDIGVQMNPKKASQVEKAVLNSFGTGWNTFEDLLWLNKALNVLSLAMDNPDSLCESPNDEDDELIPV